MQDAFLPAYYSLFLCFNRWMRHRTLPSEEGWSLSISPRLSGRDSSVKEHLRMLPQALWRPPRLFVLFLVALPFATRTVGFLHVLLVFLDLPVQLLLIAMDLGHVPSCDLWSTQKRLEVYLTVWDDKNKTERQPRPPPHSAFTTLWLLPTTSSLTPGNSGFPLWLPT